MIEFIYFFLISILKILLVIIPVLISVAYITLVERKVIASIQKREGPNFVGFLGLLQPIADGIKLLIKETLYPSHSIKLPFILAPMFVFFINLLGWLVIPLGEGIVLSDFDYGVLYLFIISSFSVYGVLIAGWSSNSKYPFLGGLRAAAQMISYDVSLGLILLSIILCTGSMNLTQIVLSQENVWFIQPHLPGFFLFFFSVLAETSRTPFDLPEAESELVSGYNTEYSSMMFALFFFR
jgi:NADH-quinone oxidoreductase subunit H